MSRLSVDLDDFYGEARKLIELESNLPSFPVKYQKLVAEIVFLRLFDILVNSFSSIACKVCCGALYLDGSSPTIIRKCSGSVNAFQQMRVYNRARARTLAWSKAAEIKENLEHLLDIRDNFMQVIDHHGNIIDEMRRVRNRIAHNNISSRKHYQVIVRRYYGANLNTITPGLLLLTPRFSPNLLRHYLDQSRILIKASVRG